MIPVGILTAAQASTGVLLLDLYPNASAAFSFRKLRTAYTGFCIRVASSALGNPTADIGFVSDVLDTAALLTFAGLNTCRIMTWYDQSGNGNNATQSIFTDAAIIVNAGTLVTDGGKVAINGNKFLLLNSAIVPNTSYAGFSVMSRTIANAQITSFSGGGVPIISLAQIDGNMYNYNKVNEIRYGFPNTGRFLFTTLNFANAQSAYLNNVIQPLVVGTAVGGGNFIQVMGWNGGQFFNGKAQEFILYNFDQTANNSTINTNINTYYSIY